MTAHRNPGDIHWTDVNQIQARYPTTGLRMVPTLIGWLLQRLPTLLSDAAAAVSGVLQATLGGREVAAPQLRISRQAMLSAAGL